MTYLRGHDLLEGLGRQVRARVEGLKARGLVGLRACYKETIIGNLKTEGFIGSRHTLNP